MQARSLGCDTFQTRKEKSHGDHTGYHLDPYVGWRSSYMATQQELGVLSKRRTGIDPSDSDHPAALWEDIKRL